MAWWHDLFSAAGWEAVQLAWEDADDDDMVTVSVERALALPEAAYVLDVPCGTGRIARRLRAHGHRVIGVDTSETFLAVARDEGVPVVRADMRTRVVRSASADAVVCLWGSFGYFDDEGNAAQARAAADALVSGGRFLVDVPVADTILDVFEERSTWDIGGVRVEENRRYDSVNKRIEETWTFLRDGTRESRTSSVRLFAVAELIELLSGVGFTSFQALDGELRPFEPGAQRLWLVAAVP